MALICSKGQYDTKEQKDYHFEINTFMLVSYCLIEQFFKCLYLKHFPKKPIVVTPAEMIKILREEYRVNNENVPK